MTTAPPPSSISVPQKSQSRTRPDDRAGAIRAGLDHPRRSIAIGAVLSAMTMVVMDGGFSNVALPTLAIALHVSPSDAILVVTAYQLAVVMALLPCAALGEKFGYRCVFAAGVGVFCAASLASALAPSLLWLVLARFAQGLGGAGILALGVALLRFSVSDGCLGAAIGWNALTVALSAAASPALGAMIISVADWHWLYVANIPLGLAILFATRALPFVARQDGRLDALSIVLNGAVFGFIVLAADAANTSPLVATALLLVAISALTALVKREKSKSRPLVPIDLLRSPSFAVSIVASISCFAGQTAGLIALPFYLQHTLGLTPAMTGLYLMAWPLSVAATAPFTGRVMRRIATGQVCAIGATLLTVGLAGISLWPSNDDPRFLIPLLMTCGVGFGLFQVANNRNMFLAALPARSAAAGGLQGSARLMGQTAGGLLIAQLFVLAPFVAPQLAMGIGAAFTLTAGFVSLLRTSTR